LSSKIVHPAHPKAHRPHRSPLPNEYN
jgi:hypothetical protein